MKNLIALLTLSLALAANAARGSDTSIPPHGDGPLEIKTVVFLLDLNAISSVNQVFTANVFYRFRWHDPRLAHNGDAPISVSLKDIWHPAVQILNRQRLFLTYPEEALVFPDGEVRLRQRAWGDFTQALDLREFPFDQHRFEIQFAATVNTPDSLVFVPDEAGASGMSEKLTLTDWVISDWQAGPARYQLVSGEITLDGFGLSLLGGRDINYFVYKIIIPLLLLVAMSWIVFWIGVEETSTQISVSITTILTLTAYRFAMGSSIPNVSYMTRLDSLILNATLLTFAALAIVVIISGFKRADKLDSARRIQKACRFVFPVLMLVSVYASLYHG